MKRFLAIPMIAATLVARAQDRLADQLQQWQPIDQLCGQIELERPTIKKIAVRGKPETRLYSTHLEGASLTLYSADGTQKQCCGTKIIATARSGRYGAFAFERVSQGPYWLRVQKDKLDRVVPIRVTRDFDSRVCRDPSVGRSVIVDTTPPKIEVRIR